MEEKSTATLENIQEAALTEFLDKGFLGASLRQIVKNAGVTTGAFYGYFPNKEALFAAIVEPHAAILMEKFMEAQTSFAKLPEKEQPSHMGEDSRTYVDWMVDYVCRHREPVKLLLTRAEGTGYENFVHNMVEVEVELYPPVSGGAPPPGPEHPGAEPVPVPHHRKRYVQWAVRDRGP